jgi:hypothetical protein
MRAFSLAASLALADDDSQQQIAPLARSGQEGRE